MKRQGNAVTLRIRQTPRLEVLLGEDGLIITDAALYDKDLTVDGLYGSYTKIFCGEIGGGRRTLCVPADPGGAGGVYRRPVLPFLRVLLRWSP